MKIHVNVWQNQYSIVKQNKVKIFLKRKIILSDNLESEAMCKSNLSLKLCKNKQKRLWKDTKILNISLWVVGIIKHLIFISSNFL